MKKHRRILNIIMTLVFLNFTLGCSYYRVNTKTGVTPTDIRWEAINGKYFILHAGDSCWAMNQLAVDSSLLTFGISTLPDNHRMYYRTDPEKLNEFQKKPGEGYEGDCLNEVHIYSSDSVFRGQQPVSIGISSIQKMEIYEYAEGPSNASHIVPVAVLVPVSAVAITAIIIALTKSSCPYVYITEGDTFKFAGEIYSGAIYASLERDDYLPLPDFQPWDGKYSVKIANRLPEIQYINQAELWIVSHPENTTVLADRNGILHTLESPLPAITAVSTGSSDQSTALFKKDLYCYGFQEEPAVTNDSSAINGIILTFNSPPGQSTAKLIVRARNSYWGDYIFGEFAKKFGTAYGKWVREKGRESPQKPLQWKKDQSLPLMVFLETSDGWQFVDYFDMAGPLAFRDMVMPVDLSTAAMKEDTDGGQVRIRIETGFMFWELDYAAMDFSADLPVNIEKVSPEVALNESGKNVKKFISKDDERHYIQPSTGNEVILDFRPAQQDDGPLNSIFLHSKGYYEHIRKFENEPDRENLVTFRQPGRLSEFSWECFSVEKEKYSRWLSSSIKK